MTDTVPSPDPERTELMEPEQKLTEAEYEPIRSALFDGPPGQGAEAAKIKIAQKLAAAGYRIVNLSAPGGQ